MSHAVVNPDREELVQCPYDPVHMITQMRFQYHLMKCRKNHEGKEYVMCPYDAKHVLLKSKLAEHLAVCDKKAIIEPQLVIDDRNARNLSEIIPPSKAAAFSDFLSNEWDDEAPSAGATKTTFTSFSKPDVPDVNSFLAPSTRSTVSSSNSFTGGAAGGTSNTTYDNIPPAMPRRPNVEGKSKYKPPTSHNSSPATYGIPSQPPSNGYYSEPPSYPSPPSTLTESYHSPGSSPGSLRKPNKPTKTLKPEPIGSSYSSSSHSFGRGRARNTPEVAVLNTEAGPASYKLPEQIDYYNPPPAMTSSFGRGRGAPAGDQPLRRPGVNEGNAKVVLEKEKMKMLKKIRQTKELEDRLEAGEVLEDNQVDKIAKLKIMQNELNKITKQLQSL